MENQQKKQQQLAAYEAAQKAEHQKEHNERASAPEAEGPESGQEEESQLEQQEQAEAEVTADEDEESEDESEDNEDDHEELYQRLVGKKVNKSGMVIDKKSGAVLGRLVEGKTKRVAGKKVGEHGEIVNDEGKVVGRVEPVVEDDESSEDDSDEEEGGAAKQQEEEQEEGEYTVAVSKDGENAEEAPVDNEDQDKTEKNVEDLDVGEDQAEDAAAAAAGSTAAAGAAAQGDEGDEEGEENPANKVDENSPVVKKSGKVLDQDDNVVGHVDPRLASRLVGFKVDEEGNVINDDGDIVGVAEMLKPDEPEEEVNPNTTVDEHSPEVRRSGKVLDEDDNIVGHVDKSAAHKLAGFKVDWDGNIINHDGHIVGKADMVKKLTEEECQEQQEEAAYRRIADQMSAAIQHALDKIKPILKSINDNIEAEEAKSEQDRNEDKLIEAVKPLIEQGSSILNEAYGAIRGLDPSGRIAKKAQAKTSDRKASPEEYHLAELLSQLSGEVTTTIDKAKKKIKNMPKAKKALSPLWNILQSPLLQILSACGLLLTGILGLVGNILNGLGLGGLVNSLLGGLGLNKILEGFGLGDALNLSGRKK